MRYCGNELHPIARVDDIVICITSVTVCEITPNLAVQNYTAPALPKDKATDLRFEASIFSCHPIPALQ